MNGNRKPRPGPSRRYADARFEICKGCGRDWNVSVKARIGRDGYRCPGCRGSKKGAKP